MKMNKKITKNDKSKKEEVKLIPKANYIKLFFIYLAVIVLVYALANAYQNNRKNKLNVPVIRGSVRELTKKELHSFITENRDANIYFCVSYQKMCRKFERDLVRVKNKNMFPYEIIYINLDENASKNDEYIAKLLKTYEADKNVKYNNKPLLVKFRDAKIKDLLYAADLNLDTAEKMLKDA